MVYSNSNQKRLEIDRVVKTVAKDNQLKLYGSFSTNSFHINESYNHSFSDIDAICLSIDNGCIKSKSKDISKTIFDRMGIYFRVSIRKQRIHTNTIPDVESYWISYFETIFKMISNGNNIEHNHYQVAKMYLRTVHKDRYFRLGVQGIRIETKLDEKVKEIKLLGGLLNELELCECNLKIRNALNMSANNNESAYNKVRIPELMRVIEGKIKGRVQEKIISDINNKYLQTLEANKALHSDMFSAALQTCR